MKFLSSFMCLRMVGRITWSISLWGLLLFSEKSKAQEIQPNEIAIICNQENKDSRAIANFYAKKRGIPREHILSLKCSQEQTISRREYEETIKNPLRELFVGKGWWKLQKDGVGKISIKQSKIRLLVLIYGMPLKIKREPLLAIAEEEKKELKRINEASLDSELMLLQNFYAPTNLLVTNPYYNKDAPFKKLGLSDVLLVGRIDGPSPKIAKRLIEDALEIEKRRLWGKVYVDIGGKHKLGDDWLRAIVSRSILAGFPVVVDLQKQLFPSHYPMEDAACYYGWYAGNRSGPLLNPKFRFKQGAIACHIHSFSAATIRAKQSRWVGPLLHHGAAAVLGNVYEPYLGYSHHVHLFHDRLLKGYTFVESAAMAQPALSWMTVAVGDPLYRPFATQAVKLPLKGRDEEYRLFQKKWEGAVTPERKEEVERALTEIAHARKSGILFEALGLKNKNEGHHRKADDYFKQALNYYSSARDQLRMFLHRADSVRGEKGKALSLLREAERKFGSIPEVEAVRVWLRLLDPSGGVTSRKSKK